MAFKIISYRSGGAQAVDAFIHSITALKEAHRDTALKTTIAAEAIPIDIDMRDSSGARVKDAFTGVVYINFHGGFGSDALGVNHPGYTAELKQALADVAVNKIAHADFRTLESNAATSVIFDLFAAPEFKQMYFTDGGSMANAEAIWAAIYTKMVDNKSRGISVKPDCVIALEGAFHGRNGTGASLTHGNKKIADHPKISSFSHVTRPGNTPKSIRETLDQIEKICTQNPNKVAAFIVEDGIQCEAGDVHIPRDFYIGLRALAEKHGFFVIYDAVQTGFFGTGEDFAYKKIGAPAPDIITGSKKSRLGHVLVGERLLSIPGNAFVAPGVIDSTWFGHSVDYMLMAASLLIIKAENLQENATVQGEKILDELKLLQKDFPEFIKDVRGMGLILTLEFEDARFTPDFIQKSFENQVIVLGSRNPNVVRIRPNLAIKGDEIADGIAGMRSALEAMRKGAFEAKL